MPHRRLLLLAVLFAPAVAEAQIILPGPAVPVVVPNGVGFQYQRRGLTVQGNFFTGYSLGAFYPQPIVVGPVGPVIAPGGVFVVPQPYSILPTYSVLNSRVSVNIIQPTVVLRSRSPYEDYDLSGVDLDVEPAPHVAGARPLAPAQPPLKQAPPRDVVKVPPPPVEVAPPVELAKVPPPKIEMPRPPADDYQHLIDLGIAAFRQRELGLATQRFQQAVKAKPEAGPAYFYLGQSYLAVARYTQAFDAIRNGLERDKQWLLTKFEPLKTLYVKQPDDWEGHRLMLEEIARVEPKQAELLFLSGYYLWLDGQRGPAHDALRAARPRLANPALADIFLAIR